jgi:hypothetical protein
MILSEINDTLDTPACVEDCRTAAAFVRETFAEAIIQGVDSRAFAETAIAIGFEELVARYGEDAVAGYAAKLSDRVKGGEFSMLVRH